MESISFDARELAPEYAFRCVELFSGGFLVMIKRNGGKLCFASLHDTAKEAILQMNHIYNYLLK